MTLIILLFSLLLGRIICIDDVTNPPLNNYIPSQAYTWERTPSYAPTPGNFDRERTPSEYSLCPSCERSPPLVPQSNRQRAFDSVEPRNGPADFEEPCYMPYVIEWRVTLNNRVLTKDTEQDLDSTPGSYWQQIKQKAERVLLQKIDRDRRVRLDDTVVVVSVNERSQRDLTKRFEKADIDWTAINKQILMWQDLLHRPKKMLTISISINYREDNSSSRGTDKRGTSSVTNRMLRQRDDQIDAEECSGQPSVWRDVYRKMRCPGPPCQHEGQYCWQDPAGKKHYRLRTHHLKSLVKYVEQGGILETHDDVPDNVREQLYAEDRQRLSKQNQTSNNLMSGSALPQININVHPSQLAQPSISSVPDTEETPSAVQDEFNDIPGPLEGAVEEYVNWHLSRVGTESYKGNIKKARDIALENCFDIAQIRGESPDFFVKQGVAIGAARRFVGHTRLWLKWRAQGNTQCT
ncbi:hypothetical protein ASPNIDRAFT_56474 [Aspergillus niger ATCC 1015]|uniref:Uncharacterized protein n=1 Tax=Aspergillus niger (strain ATCC 1015 / CBS 113.46 / FGSC A1144 / LSHB Ac4 / NCTC 3858a / NRRL 328 / USDA 3528.7) TaxID=380704 RepID=G3Y5G0_ASPNA|nr:hypothetical protein ASPNIDRAFT_56474 [Aspergillus niger ATCC 1015]